MREFKLLREYYEGSKDQGVGSLERGGLGKWEKA